MQIQFNNLLLKHRVTIFTLHNPLRQKGKEAFSQEFFKSPPAKKQLALQNCTHKNVKSHQQTFTVQNNMWIKSELLKQNHLVSHCVKEKWGFVPSQKRLPFLKLVVHFLPFFATLDLQTKQSLKSKA